MAQLVNTLAAESEDSPHDGKRELTSPKLTSVQIVKERIRVQARFGRYKFTTPTHRREEGQEDQEEPQVEGQDSYRVSSCQSNLSNSSLQHKTSVSKCLYPLGHPSGPRYLNLYNIICSTELEDTNCGQSLLWPMPQFPHYKRKKWD